MVQFAYLFLSLTYNELHRTGKKVSFPLIVGNMKKDNGAHPASEKKDEHESDVQVRKRE
ncbi:MAG: hypothetical protein M1159_01875 [Candidatus Thermoplasmatota archaeon]|jgi:hypothetical protein|nr:hypothetical protein [Candidatus Thermoplasmatota archaeon]